MNSSVSILFVVLLALVCPIQRCYGSPLDLHEIEESLSEEVVDDLVAGKQLEDQDDLEEPSEELRLHAKFQNFIEKYNKVYLTPNERQRRLEIFSQNLKKYEELNAADMGTAVYGVDQFSDMTEEEFKEKMLTFNVESFRQTYRRVYNGPDLYKKKMPQNFNWQDKGAVTPVKNQGSCGSCWAFSAIANIEGLYFLKHKKLETFSEQQLVDCVTTCYGCNGGWMVDAVEYGKENGIQKEEDYPYTALTQNCAYNSSAAMHFIKENVMLPKNEKKMQSFLFANGPVSVALDASAMIGYKGGIAHPPETYCSKNETMVNHGITLVGYGVHKIQLEGKTRRLPYWIAKNSWGPSFGQKGYYYLYRGDGSCAINQYPSSAILKN